MFPDFLQLKVSFLRIIVFFLNPKRAPEKQKRDTLLSNSLEIEGLGIYFAKEPHRPHVTKSLLYIEVKNFCGSQPCSPSREQRYYGIIELEHKTFVRKPTKILQLWIFAKIYNFGKNTEFDKETVFFWKTKCCHFLKRYI